MPWRTRVFLILAPVAFLFANVLVVWLCTLERVEPQDLRLQKVIARVRMEQRIPDEIRRHWEGVPVVLEGELSEREGQFFLGIGGTDGWGRYSEYIRIAGPPAQLRPEWRSVSVSGMLHVGSLEECTFAHEAPMRIEPAQVTDLVRKHTYDTPHDWLALLIGSVLVLGLVLTRRQF